MIASKLSRWGCALCAAFVLAFPWQVAACAACFGRSDSPLAKGMNMGIFSLVVVIGGVLSVLTSFFVYIGRKAARLREADGQEAVGGNPTHS